MKAAAAWNCVIGPQVEKRLEHPFILRDRLWGWYAHFFRKVGRDRSVPLDDVACVTRLMRVALLWMGSLMHTLPPEMTHAAQLGKAREEAWSHYQELVELAGQLAMLDDDAQQSEAFEEGRVYRDAVDDDSESIQAGRRIDAVQQEIDRRAAVQAKLNERIGGAAAVGLVQGALADAQAESAELQARYREANRRIDHAEAIAAPEDLYRITDARTKLDRMVRHQKLLDAREAFITLDVRRVERDERRFARPEISGAGNGNGMLHARLMDRLLQERRVKASEVEALFPQMVLPADGRTLKTTLRQIGTAPVNELAPVMSLLYALMAESMEEV